MTLAMCLASAGEGRLPQPGQVYVFEPQQPIPAGHLRQTADTARPLLNEPDLLIPEVIQRYFQNHYWRRNSEWDKKEVMPQFVLSADLLGFNFATAAKNFRLIDQEMISVIVPYGTGTDRILRQLRDNPIPNPFLRRRAQRLMVQLHPHTFRALRQAGQIIPLDAEERYFTLTDPNLYHPKLGILTDPSTAYSPPETLIAS